MRTVAVYPGRFHPFSLGHKGVYDHLLNDPNIDDVYILTSNKQDQDKSPFSYNDKVAMMTKTGIPASHIIQVKNPYKIDEIAQTLGLDPKQDRLIYALGSDDANRFNYTPTSPIQLYKPKQKMKPVGKHAYVKVIPQIPYNILGKKLTHASDIRKMYLDGNDNDRNQIIADLYGRVDPELKAIFDQRLGVNTPKEGIIYGAEHISAGDNPVSIMRESRLDELRNTISSLRKKIQTLRESQDYIDEYRPRKK
jgi:hypothetical protein